MERIGSNKTSLHLLRRRLQAYRSALPSLDLKRCQLIAQLADRCRRSAELAHAIDARCASLGAACPMLAAADNLPAPLTVTRVEVREEMLLGVRLPVLGDIGYEVRGHAFLSTPAWMEAVRDELRGITELALRQRVEGECIRRLEKALARTVQRINLLEKILLPSTLGHIRRIEIFLQDGERAAIVRSKMTKRRHALRHAVAGARS